MMSEELITNYNSITFPVHIQTRIVGNNCNLKCQYCNHLTENKSVNDSDSIMDINTLETFTKQYIDAQIHSSVNFHWIGGEPLLRGLDFYNMVIEMQEKYGRGRKITNTIKTNATLIDHEWCIYFKKNNFTVNLTLDGPKHCHDYYRIKNDGQGSFDDVMHGINLLRKFGIKHNIVTNINNYNVKYPLEMYNFFKDNNINQLTFQPHIIVNKGHLTEESVPPLSYGSFLCDIFDEWVRKDIGKINVSIFDNTLKIFCRKEPQNCIYAPTCGHLAMMDSNGNLYACNKYASNEYLLGSIFDDTITGMMYGRKQLRFGQHKRSALSLQCKKCSFLKFCNGGCPKDRMGSSNSGEKRHNILCQGYQKFYKHVTPAMTFMAEEIIEGGNHARIMSYFE